MFLKHLLFAAALIGWVTSCGDRDEWQGWIYPDRNDLTNSVPLESFDSLEACRDAAIERLRSMGAELSGDYECGLNCRESSELPGIKICEETKG